MSEHKGWYWPRHLPHRDEPGLVQAITFRLHDSLPQSWLRQQAYLRKSDDDPALEQRLLDRGLGACTLGRSRAPRSWAVPVVRRWDALRAPGVGRDAEPCAC